MALPLIVAAQEGDDARFKTFLDDAVFRGSGTFSAGNTSPIRHRRSNAAQPISVEGQGVFDVLMNTRDPRGCIPLVVAAQHGHRHLVDLVCGSPSWLLNKLAKQTKKKHNGADQKSAVLAMVHKNVTRDTICT